MRPKTRLYEGHLEETGLACWSGPLWDWGGCVGLPGAPCSWASTLHVVGQERNTPLYVHVYVCVNVLNSPVLNTFPFCNLAFR